MNSINTPEGSASLPLDNLLVGCMVLTSTQATHLPLFSQASLKPHVEGTVNGKVGTIAHTQVGPLFVPQKGRSYFLSASCPVSEDAAKNSFLSELQGDLVESDSEFGVSSRVQDATLRLGGMNGLYSWEQIRPFGFVALSAVNCELYMYGLHSPRVSVLYWTNMDPVSFEARLRDECGNAFWFYRFLPRRNLSLVLHTKRICSRWYRWGESPNMRDPSRRFQALETSLVNNSLPYA